MVANRKKNVLTVKVVEMWFIYGKEVKKNQNKTKIQNVLSL